ncbi:MAG: DNA topoisomerase 4 subunit A, partial [Patescibacteria group bacterium]|nr:DNA topoisomerase 4 subunit A [Patescibacteria group bacterium]
MEKVVPVYIEDEMKVSYLDYAMSVIVGRALPDVRDGLKPVHRRILYAMNELGVTFNKPHKKSARIVGEVLGKYHPHGDVAVYDTIVRMVQEFSTRYPLIDGQGNFGSVDGDQAAAMRYTEVRLSPLALIMLDDIEKETVDFIPNFDDSLKEPEVLPAKLPNLLINGSSGIAVGMATNIPPHNLREVVTGIIMVIDNKEVTIEDLMSVIPGPDFPTGGFVFGGNGIREAYETGKGKIVLQARSSIERLKGGREAIIISELPYQVNKADLVKRIADLVKEKRIEGISELRDESDRDGMRIVVELKKNEDAKVVLNQLYKHTPLRTSFSIILLSLVDSRPEILNLKQMIEQYIKHRKEIITRRTKYDLKQAEAKVHILEGLKIALRNLDEVIRIIRSSKTPDGAKKGLVESFSLTDVQAQAILDMRLQRLTSLEREKINKEYLEVIKTIEDLRSILASEKRIYEIIKEELLEIKDKYGDDR